MVPKLKKIGAWLFVKAGLKVAVPAVGLLKLKVSVCQALAAVVRASVWTLRVGSPAVSTFRRTDLPAAGA